MKTNDAIEASKRRVIAWGNFLVTTFRILSITDNEVIQNCYVGRSTYYRMKQGELINVDAYIRMNDYAIAKIQEHEAKGRLPAGYGKEWIGEVVKLVFF